MSFFIKEDRKKLTPEEQAIADAYDKKAKEHILSKENPLTTEQLEAIAKASEKSETAAKTLTKNKR